jgi:hypothetical protein
VQFRELFSKPESSQLSEEVGEALAKWASGGVKGNPEIDAMVADYAKASTQDELNGLEERRGAMWKKTPAADKQRLKEASDAASQRLKRPTASQAISMDQATVLAESMKEEGVELSLLLAKFEIGAIEDLPAAKFEDARDFIAEMSAGG